jgi:hypothetical protein
MGRGQSPLFALRADTRVHVKPRRRPLPTSLRSDAAFPKFELIHLRGAHNKSLCHCPKRSRQGTTSAREVLTPRAKLRSLAFGPAWQTSSHRAEPRR